MKVIDRLKTASSTLISFEILPPLKGYSIQSIYDILDPLIEFKPPFIDVTYHREEYVYKKTSEGYFEKISIRKRPGTVGICAAIINKYKVDAVPHLICGGFSKEETENALIDLNFLGVDNVLLIRGDARKPELTFEPEPDGNIYAIDLVKQVTRMNKGIYMHEEILNGQHSDFCIGVAGYPEKHFESPNIKSDMKFLKQKVDAGAHYIVTQMFFDNRKYFDFVETCRRNDIHVPIIPGLKPLTRLKQVTSLPRTFHVDIPDELADEAAKCKSDADVVGLGIEWGTQQCRELIEFGVPCLHFYTMGDVKSVKTIVKGII